MRHPTARPADPGTNVAIMTVIGEPSHECPDAAMSARSQVQR